MDNKPNPHKYHVMDVSSPAAPLFVAEFHAYKAAKEYALEISMTGALIRIDKGEYAR